MDMPTEAELAEQLGDELRTLRTGQGLTRKGLQARWPSTIAVQSIATYELGTRAVTMFRLFELAATLNVQPSAIVQNVERRLAFDTRDGLLLRLDVFASSKASDLSPVQRWAAVVLRQLPPGERPEIHLSEAALERLAELCGMMPSRLTGRLRRLQLAE